MKRSRNACCSAAPVKAAYAEPIETQCVRKIHQVLSDGRLLPHTRARSVSKAGCTESTQVRNQYAVPCFRQRRSDIVPGVHIVGKTVKEDNRHAIWVA